MFFDIVIQHFLDDGNRTDYINSKWLADTSSFQKYTCIVYLQNVILFTFAEIKLHFFIWKKNPIRIVVQC